MPDIDRYQYGYDRNSNRIWKRNTVGSGLDEFYTYDRLNRLNQMQRGTLTGTPPTGITGTPAKEQDWTLDPVGNWSAFINKTAGTTDLNQTRTSNQVNEITAIGGTPGWATPPAYDAVGNMTSFPQPTSPGSAFGAVYDAWNRLTKVTDGANTVAEYAYDGFGRRIVKKTYTGGTLTETRHIYWNIGWQAIEERVGTSTTADRQQVWGGRYVDELVCRDDPTHGRLYALQDANFNLTAIVDAVGVVVERSNYTPYGVISYLAPNWSSRAVSSYGWVVGFQGLLYDPETGNWYQRARYRNVLHGNFQQRDPIGYGDGTNLYEAIGSNPITRLDPSGTRWAGWRNPTPTERDMLKAGLCVLTKLGAFNNEYRDHARNIIDNALYIGTPTDKNSPLGETGWISMTINSTIANDPVLGTATFIHELTHWIMGNGDIITKIPEAIGADGLAIPARNGVSTQNLLVLLANQITTIICEDKCGNVRQITRSKLDEMMCDCNAKAYCKGCPAGFSPKSIPTTQP